MSARNFVVAGKSQLRGHSGERRRQFFLLVGRRSTHVDHVHFYGRLLGEGRRQRRQRSNQNFAKEHGKIVSVRQVRSENSGCRSGPPQETVILSGAKDLLSLRAPRKRILR